MPICVHCGVEMRFHHKEKGYRIKHFYQCPKCKKIYNVITWASYDELVLSGQIKVSPEKYRYIKEKYRR